MDFVVIFQDILNDQYEMMFLVYKLDVKSFASHLFLHFYFYTYFYAYHVFTHFGGGECSNHEHQNDDMSCLFFTIRDVRGRIQAAIAETFGVDPTLMYLTKPTFFSRINSTAAKTQHDEYWHPHIDKVTHKNRAATCYTLDN